MEVALLVFLPGLILVFFLFYVVGHFRFNQFLGVSKLCYSLVLCHVLVVALVDENRCSRYSDGSFLF